MGLLPPEETRPFSAVGGPLGVLLLHGYTGSPASFRALGLAFADHGVSVELPCLAGHGSSVTDLMATDFSSWLADAQAAFVELSSRCRSVVVCGHSMGGTLACTMALEQSDLAGLVLINPFIEPPADEFVSMMRAALDGGIETIPSIGADIAKPGVRSGGYDATPIKPLLSLFSAARDLIERLEEINTNVLLLSSRVDHVVAPSSSDLLEQRVAGPIERVVLESSFHDALRDYDAPEIEARAIAFVDKIAARR